MILNPRWPQWRIVKNLNDIFSKAESHGEMYIQGNTTATTIGTSDTWVQVTGWTGAKLQNVTFASDELTVSNAGDYQVNVAISMTGAGADTWTFGIAVNDTVDETSRVERKTTSVDVGALALVGIETLAVDDTVQLYVKNQTLTNNPTITEAALTLHMLSH